MQGLARTTFVVVLGLVSCPGCAMHLAATRERVPTPHQNDKATLANATEKNAKLSMRELAMTYNIRWAAPKTKTTPAQCPETSSPLEMHVHSQFREDIALNQFVFWGKTEGTFIEIGAYNGLWMSNTWMLETYFGWHGLLVEANPANYKELPINRPTAYAINAAAATGEPHTVTLSGDKKGGGSSKIKNDNKHGQTVPALPLKTLAEAVGLNKVNLLSLDVEGAELDVLKSLGLELLKNLDLLIVERNPGYSDVVDYLVSHNFTTVSQAIPSDMRGPNEWWKGPGFSLTKAPDNCRNFIVKQVEKKKWTADLDSWIGRSGKCPRFHRVNYSETDLGQKKPWVAPPLKKDCRKK